MAQIKPGGRITRSPGWWPGQAGGGRAGAVSEPPARRAQVWHQPSSEERARRLGGSRLSPLPPPRPSRLRRARPRRAVGAVLVAGFATIGVYVVLGQNRR